MIFDEKWLNATVSMKKIEESLASEKMRIGNDIFTLSSLPEFGFEATEVYKSTLDINQALNEGRRLSEIQRRKAEHEAALREKKRAEEQANVPSGPEASVDHTPVSGAIVAESTDQEPEKQWVAFRALLSTEDALALKAFFDGRNIVFEAV